MTTDPKGSSGASKAQLHLIPLAAQIECAGALALGKAKYGERNWANASPGSSTYIAASLRHILAWQSGEDLDPESGLSHLGHAMAGLAIMLDAKALGTLVDERVRPETELTFVNPSTGETVNFKAKQAKTPINKRFPELDFENLHALLALNKDRLRAMGYFEVQDWIGKAMPANNWSVAQKTEIEAYCLARINN